MAISSPSTFVVVKRFIVAKLLIIPQFILNSNNARKTNTCVSDLGEITKYTSLMWLTAFEYQAGKMEGSVCGAV